MFIMIDFHLHQKTSILAKNRAIFHQNKSIFSHATWSKLEQSSRSSEEVEKWKISSFKCKSGSIASKRTVIQNWPKTWYKPLKWAIYSICCEMGHCGVSITWIVSLKALLGHFWYTMNPKRQCRKWPIYFSIWIEAFLGSRLSHDSMSL